MPDETNPQSRRNEAPPSAGPAEPVRLITAASLFDGHDASINIMRRILQSCGAEVVHLGHNRSVDEVVTAAIQEDAHGIAISSYQGGHVEYFKYMIDLLKARGRPDIKVFGGGGGVIVADEVKELEAYGVSRIYSPEDGRALGLKGMIEDMIDCARRDLAADVADETPEMADDAALARVITALEEGRLPQNMLAAVRDRAARRGAKVPVLGITGTGGAGKSSLTDEVIRRFRFLSGEPRIAVFAIDPTRRKTGGALLGDRIRMNAISAPNIFFRSLATRDAQTEIPAALPDMILAAKASGADLVIIETPGIGQGDAGIVPYCDVSLYVMTPEFGAASQLEKIDMLDFADVVAINKMDRKGAKDALRDVRKQVQRNREAFTASADDMPVFGTIASRFNDIGVTSVYQELCQLFTDRGCPRFVTDAPTGGMKTSEPGDALVPPDRVRYLAEIAGVVRTYHAETEKQVTVARERQHLREAARLLAAAGQESASAEALAREKDSALSSEARQLLDGWPALRARYRQDTLVQNRGGQDVSIPLRLKTLSGTEFSRVAVPAFEDEGEQLKWLRREGLPGHFPFTAGVFPFKRADEDPTRMFAGEGDPARTNGRFKYLSRHSTAKRLSTAFDSVTLYGFDPDERPDIFGKVGNSGVSVATLDDMKTLYDGFDLCDPQTSVSMTINGPAPTILAMFLNTAIDQRLAAFETEKGRPPSNTEASELKAWVLSNVRGTVQADILKEDQGQNTCIFSTEFALRMMADIQEYFVENRVRNFYSVSISGYHIAEAGANPISQLAFTLANGFTFVETYLARGMDVDDFAPSLSFFFSNGMDPEYTVMGRVARRIWATAMRDRYGAGERAQKLKYHIQTSGRSLHAQEMDFNDIRTTLQALIAVYDNCNSLHTNAFDEAFTTPTEESLRRAMAIQMIINREWGLARNENPNQGAFILEELTDLVEEAVLQEFERISERGGVLGAMETGYQRGKIQDESLHYETLKHDGTLPIIGVNTFLPEDGAGRMAEPPLQRSSLAEKNAQIRRLKDFKERHKETSAEALSRLKEAAQSGNNIFTILMDTVRCCSLGEITNALFEAGGQYRRNM